MRCPLHPEFWHNVDNHGDPRIAAHLASCPHCREEAGQLSRLQDALAGLPALAVPAQVGQQFAHLEAAARGQAFTCDEALDLIEPWRDGALDPIRAFLMEDHLLWCPSCAEALAQAEQLSTVLRVLPEVDAPAAVAERIARARQPWWQRLLPPVPSISFDRLGWAGAASVAAVTLVMALMPALRGPQIAQKPVSPVTIAPITAQYAAPIGPVRVATAVRIATVQPPTQHTVSRPHISVNCNNAESAQAEMLAMLNGIAEQAVSQVPMVFLTGSVARTDTAPAPQRKSLPAMVATAVQPAAPSIDDRHRPEPPRINYTASAREALLRMAREDELASLEESLSSVDTTLLAAVPRRVPVEVPRDSMESNAALYEHLNERMNNDLRRLNTPNKLTPITLNERDSMRADNDGVLYIVR